MAWPWVDPPTFVANTYPTAVNLNVLSEDIRRLYVPPACEIFRTNSQAVGNDTFTVLGFDGERTDTDTMHGAGSTITFRRAGTYAVGYSVVFPANNTTGRREAGVILNGSPTAFVLREWDKNPSASLDSILSRQRSRYFAALDTIALQVYQNSGGSLTIPASTGYQCDFWATWLGTV